MLKKTIFLLITLIAAAMAVQIPVSAALPLALDGQTLPSLSPMLKRVMPGVVNISTKTQIQQAEHPLMRDPVFRHFFGVPSMPSQRESSSLGSGVIVDAHRGYVLTNNHVIDKADEITVTLNDGRKLKAKLVGADKESDIAVIEVKGDHLTALPIANSDQLQVGDFLVDLNGQLAGINTAILAPTGGNVGIGFALPVNMAMSIMNTLVTHGEVKRGLLGVTVQDLTHELADAFKLNQTQGAVITGVKPGSPAESADLETGDVVLTINGKKVKNSADVRNMIGLAQIGDAVEIEVIHKGSTVIREATVAAPKISESDGATLHPKLAGLKLRDIQDGNGGAGVLIDQMNTASYAYRVGLKPGDVIVAANRKPTGSTEDLLKAVKGTREILLNVMRGPQGLIVVLR